MYDTTLGWRFVNPVMGSGTGCTRCRRPPRTWPSEYGVDRAEQDEFALRSQQRAAKAKAEGRFAEEIVLVPVPPAEGGARRVDVDEHPRATSLEELAALPPLFPDGTVTAGNSSGVNDGAAALLVASEGAVRRYGLAPLARIGVGGVPASPRSSWASGRCRRPGRCSSAPGSTSPTWTWSS